MHKDKQQENLKRAFIIAEIANAHQGNPDDALKLAREAFRAGADAVKFQFYTASELLVPKHPRYEHFKNQEFSSSVWQGIVERINQENMVWYADVFGIASFELAVKLGAHGIKVHSSDIEHKLLLSKIAGSGLPIFISTGATRLPEIEYAICLILEINKNAHITLLHGFQAYPTEAKDAALCRIGFLKDTFGKYVNIGYMDHSSRENPLAFSLPMVAIAFGATVIEKHISLNPEQKGVDYHSSFTPAQFKEFVLQIRDFESTFSLKSETFSDEEKKYGNQVKKTWIVNRDMSKGESVKESDLTMKRVFNITSYVPSLRSLVNHELKHDILAFEPISRVDVGERYWAFVVVRLASTRLAKKALLDVGGVPAIYHLLKRLEQSKALDKIVLCTTSLPEDDELVNIANSLRIESFRGASSDVLDRMLCAVSSLSTSCGYEPDGIIRVTGDDILVDPGYIDKAIDYHRAQNADYTDLKALPSGTEVEVFCLNLLRYIKAHATDSTGTEYLTSFVRHHNDQFKVASTPVCDRHARSWRLTLDTKEDYQVIKFFVEEMANNGKHFNYTLDDIVDYFEARPEQLDINASVRGRGTPIEIDTTMNWSASLKPCEFKV